jgi:hypothetical protein
MKTQTAVKARKKKPTANNAKIRKRRKERMHH